MLPNHTLNPWYLELRDGRSKSSATGEFQTDSAFQLTWTSKLTLLLLFSWSWWLWFLVALSSESSWNLQWFTTKELDYMFRLFGKLPKLTPQKNNLITSVEVDDQNSPSQIRAFGVFPCLDFRIGPFYVTKFANLVIKTQKMLHLIFGTRSFPPFLPEKNVNFG